MRFEGIIKRACRQEGQCVAILVDEYDKPMLQAIGNDALQKSFRNTLKAFYGALKSQDGCIKFAMLTGVAKFGKFSVFSDLNNLNDISMWNKYIDICGVSEQELYDNLDAELHEFANVQEVTYEEICVRLKEMYDGYHLRTILRECTILSACFMLLIGMSLGVIGLKRVLLLIWWNC